MPLFFWINTARRFLFRSFRSTAALFFMVFSSVAMLIFLSAIAAGINDAMIRNSVGLFSGHLSGQDLPDTIGREDLIVDGVAQVLKRFKTRCILDHAGHRDMITLYGVTPSRERITTFLHRKTSQGRFPRDNAQEIYISEMTARNLQAGVGDTIMIQVNDGPSPLSSTICGIYTTGMEKFDRNVAITPVTGFITATMPWQAAVFLAGGGTSKEVMTAYTDRGWGSFFSTWEALMPDLSQLIDLNHVAMWQ